MGSVNVSSKIWHGAAAAPCAPDAMVKNYAKIFVFNRLACRGNDAFFVMPSARRLTDRIFAHIERRP
jgi:hypothetical protein